MQIDGMGGVTVNNEIDVNLTDDGCIILLGGSVRTQRPQGSVKCVTATRIDVGHLRTEYVLSGLVRVRNLSNIFSVSKYL